MGKRPNKKRTPVPIDLALEGAQLALDNARQWLNDASLLIQRGSLGHAQALLLFGCEEVGKAMLWSGAPISSNQPGQRKDPRLIVVSGQGAHRVKLAVGALMTVLAYRLQHWQQLISAHKDEVDAVADRLDNIWEENGIDGVPDMMAQLISTLRLLGIDFVSETIRLKSVLDHVEEMSDERMLSMYVDWTSGGFSTPLQVAPALTAELLLSVLNALQAGCDLVQEIITGREPAADVTVERKVYRAAMWLDKPLPTRTVYLLARKHPSNPDVQTIFLGTTFSDYTAAETKAHDLNTSKDLEDNQSPWEVIAEEVPHIF